jgi:hypothetical protein
MGVVQARDAGRSTPTAAAGVFALREFIADKESPWSYVKILTSLIITTTYAPASSRRG